MSENPAETAKSCALCGTDVTGKPRVKDAKGRYFCRECAAKKQAELARKVDKTARPASLAPAEGDADIMARLVDDSIHKGEVSCPACRRPWKQGAVICTGCGFNKQSGQLVGTQIQQPEIVKGPKVVGGKGGKRRGNNKFAGAHWKIALVLVAIYGGGFALTAVDQQFAPVFMMGVMLYTGAMRIFAAFDAYTESDSVIKAAFVFLCDLYMLYYCALETENDLLKGTAWAYIIVFLLVIVAVFALGVAIAGMGGMSGDEFGPMPEDLGPVDGD